MSFCVLYSHVHTNSHWVVLEKQNNKRHNIVSLIEQDNATLGVFTNYLYHAQWFQCMLYTNQNKTAFGEHPAVTKLYVQQVLAYSGNCCNRHNHRNLNHATVVNQTMPWVSERSQALQIIESAIEVTVSMDLCAGLIIRGDKLEEDLEDLLTTNTIRKYSDAFLRLFRIIDLAACVASIVCDIEVRNIMVCNIIVVVRGVVVRDVVVRDVVVHDVVVVMCNPPLVFFTYMYVLSTDNMHHTEKAC